MYHTNEYQSLALGAERVDAVRESRKQTATLSRPPEPVTVQPPSGAGVPTMAAVCDTITSALTSVIDEACDPQSQKRRLMARIQSVVSDPSMKPYVAGAAADLVVFHDLPLAEIDLILGDIEALRAAGSLVSSGAFFNFKASKLARQRGKPWPAKRIPKASGEQA